jgi:SAM-dependent methyltransferase
VKKPVTEIKTPIVASWNNAEAYERYMGRWSGLVAREFVSWLAVPPQHRWLEIGCGTGALTQAIIELGSPKAVRATDLSADFVAFARSRVNDARASFAVMDAAAPATEPGAYDIAVSGLLLNNVPNPAAALGKMALAIADGGTVASYVWDYADGMQFLRYFWDAVSELDGNASSLDEGKRFPLCRPEALRKLFEEAGLRGIAVDSIKVPTEFASFEDYWRPFEGGQGPAPGYVSTLGPQKRAELKKRLSETLPISEDGSIRLTAKAWAVRGSK